MENTKGHLHSNGYHGASTYPNLPQSWGLFGIFIGASLFLGATFTALQLILNMIQSRIGYDYAAQDVDNNTRHWFTLIAFLGSFAITFLAATLYAKGRGLHFKVSRRPATWWIYLLLLPMTPAMALLVDSLSSLLPMPEFIEKKLAEMVSLNLPSFLTAVIAAPILEEILCRGMILEGLLKHTSPYKAILWSALLFAALHLNPWQGLAAFAIGCVSGWIYWKTRSLGPCIFIHFVNNGMAFSLLYMVKDPTVSASDLFGDQYGLALAVSVAVVGVCGYILYIQLNQDQDV